jgi:hypothetical protein
VIAEEEKLGLKTPGRALAQNMLTPHPPNWPDGYIPLPARGTSTPQKGYDAHHIVAAGEKREGLGAEAAQQLAYTCKLHPNDWYNGVWVRGYRLYRTTSAYRNILHADERRIAEHPTLGKPRYHAWVASRLDAFASYDGECYSQALMADELGRIRSDISVNKFPKG